MLYLDKILDKPFKCGWDPCVPVHEHRGYKPWILSSLQVPCVV